MKMKLTSQYQLSHEPENTLLRMRSNPHLLFRYFDVGGGPETRLLFGMA